MCPTHDFGGHSSARLLYTATCFQGLIRLFWNWWMLPICHRKSRDQRFHQGRIHHRRRRRRRGIPAVTVTHHAVHLLRRTQTWTWVRSTHGLGWVQNFKGWSGLGWVTFLYFALKMMDTSFTTVRTYHRLVRMVPKLSVKYLLYLVHEDLVTSYIHSKQNTTHIDDGSVGRINVLHIS